MNAEPPLVTVVTPSFNQGPFIAETIESVLRQDYPRLEHWVLDGGSKDQTVEICRRFAEDDPRFHFVSEPDGGFAAAVNKGFRRASGEIIGWLNSDDTYLPGAISSSVAELAAHPDAGIVYGDAIYIDANGRRLGRYHSRPFDRVAFLRTAMVPQPTAFYRRSVIERHRGLDERLKYAVDYELFSRAMFDTGIRYQPRLVATYRIHGQSKTGAEFQRLAAEARTVVERICDAHPELAPLRDRALSDWHLTEAIQLVESRRWSEAGAAIRTAVSRGGVRPRLATVGLKACETLTGLPVAELGVRILDRLASLRQRSR